MICFRPYFRNTSLCYASRVGIQLGKLFGNGFISCCQWFSDNLIFSIFSFSSALLHLYMSLLILVVLLRGLFVLLQLGRCHIIQSRIILFAPLFYLVIGSRCPVCPGVLSTIVVCSQLFLVFHLCCSSGYLPSLFFMVLHISTQELVFNI